MKLNIDLFCVSSGAGCKLRLQFCKLCGQVIKFRKLFIYLISTFWLL